MLQKWYGCDCGSIVIKMGESFFRINNGLGDGSFKVYLFESREEFGDYEKAHEQFNLKFRFVTLSTFTNAEVLCNDCIDSVERYNNYKIDGELVNPTLFTLQGQFYIYCCEGKIYIVKNK